MRVSVELENGLYEIQNGDESDNYPYRALLAIYEGEAWASEWTTNSNFTAPLHLVTITEGSDLFATLGVKTYHRA